MTYETVCNSTDRDAWLEARKTGIGASEMAAVLGLDKYTSEVELFLRKTGQVVDDDESEAAEWGQELEPVIVRGFARRTGRYCEMAGRLLRSTEYPWAMATLDAWQLSRFDPYQEIKQPLEVKLTGGRARDWQDGVPEYYYVQCQQQMLVTGADWMSIAALLNGTKLVYADVQRDEAFIARIVEEGSRFWRCVTDDTMPPPDGSKSAGWALKKLYAEASDDTIALDWECADETVRYDDVCVQLKSLEAERERIRQSVQARLGAAIVGVLPGENGLWTWKATKKGVRVLNRRKAKS